MEPSCLSAVLLSSVAQWCDHFSPADRGGHRRDTELAQYFDSRSPVWPRSSQLTRLGGCGCGCTPTGLTRSQIGQSGLSQSHPGKLTWNLSEMRKPRSAGGGCPHTHWAQSEGREMRNVCFSPNLLSVSAGTQNIRRWFANFIR